MTCDIQVVEAKTPTSEASEWLVYDPNDWFTIYSHTDHRGHVLHQVLCGEEEMSRQPGGGQMME